MGFWSGRLKGLIEESELVSELGRGKILVLCSFAARNQRSILTAVTTVITRVW